MDNLTHTLTGLALSRAGLNRYSPRAVLLLVLSANVPDIDILALSGGSLHYLEAHRGYSHSLFCLPLMAALPVLVVAAIYRQKLPWMKAWLICCAGVGSHLLLDWTNSFGIRLLLPFSSRWLHLDLNSLYDGWILGILLFGAVWPMFSRLVSKEIGDRAPTGCGAATAALSLLVLFDCGRAILHARVIGQLQARVYDDAPLVQTAALPEPFTPLRWTGIVETERDYRAMDVDAFGQLEPQYARTFYKPPITLGLERAAATEPFRYFLYFARFPVWSEEAVTAGTNPGRRLELTDLRFGTPGAGSFHCIALENARGVILHTWFTFGSGAHLGRGEQSLPAVR
ncbi:MAG TPA: metal-dependent hydrolase [Bryobacteraceae bacterium]|jgi:inner membrane protein